jgi:hypothetical protein
MSLEVKDERVRAVPMLGRLLSRPELGAIAGTVLIFVFFGITAGDSGCSVPRALSISWFRLSSAFLRRRCAAHDCREFDPRWAR